MEHDPRPRSAGNARMARRARRRARAGGAGPRALPDRAADRQGAPLGRVPAVLGEHRLHQHDPGRPAGAGCPATSRSSSGSAATSAGTRWRWCCAPTRTPTSAATSRASPRRRRSTTSASTTSGTRRPRATAATSSSSRATRAPGIYARAFLEGRLTEEQLDNFRQEVDGKGISSYPHPWLMPDFWQFPTVSMGLGPLMAIYQARFMKYLHDRGLAETDGAQGLGVPAATARWTSRSRWARSRWPAARSSTT